MQTPLETQRNASTLCPSSFNRQPRAPPLRRTHPRARPRNHDDGCRQHEQAPHVLPPFEREVHDEQLAPTDSRDIAAPPPLSRRGVVQAGGPYDAEADDEDRAEYSKQQPSSREHPAIKQDVGRRKARLHGNVTRLARASGLGPMGC